MARNPTQMIIEGLACDPGVLRDARRRITIEDEPAGLRDRLASIVRRDRRRGYAVARNERAIRTDVRLGHLRRELVQWSTQYAPPAIGGYRDLLVWALGQVDWSAVVYAVAGAPEPCARRGIMTLHPVG